MNGNESIAANTLPLLDVHHCSCGGRIRYAPTVFRLIVWRMIWHRVFVLYSLVDYRTGVGAYRIRPDVVGNELIVANTLPSLDVHHCPCGGRMRYAPIVFGSKHGWHDGQTNPFDTNMNKTTSSNEPRRCQHDTHVNAE